MSQPLFIDDSDFTGGRGYPQKRCTRKKNGERCGNTFIQYKTTTKHCIPCVIELTREKVRKDKKKADKEKDKKIREKLKTLGQYEKEARKEFQKWIRWRDRNLPCISCGSSSDKVDAGHFFKAEIYSGLIFDEDNCHKQCKRCNQHLHGNELEYRIGLVARYGEVFVLNLEQKKDGLRNYKYSKQQLIGIKEYYKNKLKEVGL